MGIRFERLLNHPVKKVWDAITNPEQLALWLSPNHENSQTEIDLRLGGRIRLQYMMALPEGTITGLEMEKLLEIKWSEESMTRWSYLKKETINAGSYLQKPLTNPLHWIMYPLIMGI